MKESILNKIHWLGHASFRIDGKSATVYIDPWQISDGSKPADIILITHDHRDHCSPEDVDKIQVDGTKIITVKDSADKLQGEVKIIKPGDTLTLKGISIRAVPAYNLTKFRSPGVVFHPKNKGYVGFIISIDGETIYHAGDTDIIPEMSDFKTDIALLPVSGKYVMTAEEALEAAEIIGPKILIPMHIGRGIGSETDADRFKSESTIPVRLLPFED